MNSGHETQEFDRCKLPYLTPHRAVGRGGVGGAR